MNRNNNIDIQEDKLKELLSGTRMKASDNLKSRIMQQIITERALSKKKMKQSRPILENMLAIFGIMYALISVVGFGIYTSLGKEALGSMSFYIPAILISSICVVYWMIINFDDRRQTKHNSKRN